MEAFRLLEVALRDPEIGRRVSRDSPFYGITSAQLLDVLKEMGQEVELESSLALMASFEARLRVDYLTRGRRGLGGVAPSDAFIRRLWSKFEERLPLEELLDAWRDATQAEPDLVGRFKQLMRFRDWLAHGRYWPPKGFAGFDTNTVVRVAAAMERAIPGLPKLIDW
jgi:hypothetical protein